LRIRSLRAGRSHDKCECERARTHPTTTTSATEHEKRGSVGQSKDDKKLGRKVGHLLHFSV
jgi:hypothetical protein